MPDLERLIAAARGETAVDQLLRNARLVNVLAGEIHPADVAVYDGRVVGFGDYPARETVDLGGRYLCPGLIDAHVHLESAMVTPSEFARAVVPRGTTAVVADPHELANVLGLDGVRYILDASQDLPLAVYVMLPSCVPATSMETAGAYLAAADLRMLFNHPRVIGLAEMMNYPGVIARAPDVLEKLAAAGTRPVDGHAPGLSGRDLAAYVAAGIGSDHECTTADEAREKLRMGMHLMIREGSTAHNLEALLPLVTPYNAERCSLCTDDRHPADLLNEGHIDYLVKLAVHRGLNPVTAIQMATINSARYFGLRRIGAVAPGYQADLVVFDDFEDFRVRQVYQRGRKVAEDGHYLPPPDGTLYVPLRSTVNVDRMLDLRLRVPQGARNPVRVRVIGVVPGQIVTQHLIEEVVPEEGLVIADPERDLLKIAVVERHLATGNVGVGLIRGFGMQYGAIASSVAHDSHNIVVIGADDADMAFAVHEVARLRGGQAVVAGGEVLAALPLPIAGLMSDLPLERVRARIEDMTETVRDLGGTLPDPLMTMSFMALPVIPDLKLTDKGLVDVSRFEPVPVFLTP